MEVSETEAAAMHRALALAETVRGHTSPNPSVGAVILDAAGHLAGEGTTAPAGGPHAEVVALRSAGDDARGGTAVVTLEPCAHTGRTGPCVEALLAAGVAKVIYAVDDPNPEAAGGAERLREAGVEVVDGVEAHAAASGALRPWLHAIRTGRPYVTWKFAATLDGRVAAADYTSQWITSATSRADVHALRGVVDAILVGSGTVLADDPQLTVRDTATPVLRQPLRVVLDRRHRVSDDARVLDTAAETLVLDVAVPQFALKALYDRGVRHVLLEGGPTLAGAFVEARCVDEVVAYLAPTLLGAGPAALGEAGIGTLGDAVSLDIESVSRLADDLDVVGVRRRGDSAVLTVRADRVRADAEHGASIAVDGVCLTVVGRDDTTLTFDVMGETLTRSAGLAAGGRVNLERAVRADGRLDGHVVQGHVDGAGVVISRTPGDDWETVRFGVPAELARYIAEKGSIAVSGVSLTVSAVGDTWFEVGLIPETLRATTLGGKAAGDPVNLEVDVLAKYVARLLETAR